MLVTRSEAGGISFWQRYNSVGILLDHISNSPPSLDGPTELIWRGGEGCRRRVAGFVLSASRAYTQQHHHQGTIVVIWPLCSSTVTRSEAVGGWGGWVACVVSDPGQQDRPHIGAAGKATGPGEAPACRNKKFVSVIGCVLGFRPHQQARAARASTAKPGGWGSTAKPGGGQHSDTRAARRGAAQQSQAKSVMIFFPPHPPQKSCGVGGAEKIIITNFCGVGGAGGLIH